MGAAAASIGILIKELFGSIELNMCSDPCIYLYIYTYIYALYASICIYVGFAPLPATVANEGL